MSQDEKVRCLLVLMMTTLQFHSAAGHVFLITLLQILSKKKRQLKKVGKKCYPFLKSGNLKLNGLLGFFSKRL